MQRNNMEFVLGFSIDAGLHEHNLLVHSWDIEYMPIAKNQMREIMLRVAWKSGSGEKAKTSDLGIVYDAYADNETLNVGIEDRRAKKVYRLRLQLASLDQTLFLRTDPKLTFSSHGYMVNSKSGIHDWVQAIRRMRELLLTKEIFESNVWKLAWACNKIQVIHESIGTIVSKNLFPSGALKWEEWVADRIVSLRSKTSSKSSNATKAVTGVRNSDQGSIPSSSQTNEVLDLAADLVMPISMVEPDDDFPEAPLLLKDSDHLLAPTQKSKSKHKQTAPIDIRDNILLHEDELREVNIDPKDDTAIRAEAERIKDSYSYVHELEILMKQSVETPSAAIVSPYTMTKDEAEGFKRDFVTLHTVEEVTKHVADGGLFMVISGAHSTRAMKLIVRSVMQDSANHYYDRARQLRVRSCVIVDVEFMSDRLSTLRVILLVSPVG
ncbi:hypothetical protein R1sor_025131 [Riccia sorocarpa]|uniref:Uncharacterized protein n=1 Tax=Riccia sorocarpa TaxID=122646 RepID=A0ABD3G7Q7_9MARC